MASLLLMVFLSVAACGVDALPVSTNPFVLGSFGTDYFHVPQTNSSPVHSMVFYPTKPGVYPLYFFVPGFRGMLPSSMHTVYLNGVASHGYVVVSTDHMTMDSFDVRVRNFIAQYNMVTADLNNMLKTQAPGISANMGNITIGSHSAGGEVTVAMMKHNHTGVKASVFLEPMVMYVNTTVPFSLPAVMFGTQYAEEGSVLIPPCVFPQYDYEHLYSHWVAPRLQMEAMGYGHCDIMDPTGRQMCMDLHLCKANKTADLGRYQLYLQGLTTGFLDWVLFGKKEISYLTEPSYAPIKIQNLKFDLGANEAEA